MTAETKARVVIIGLIVTSALTFGSLIFYFHILHYRHQVETITVNDVVLSNIPDGVYRGSANTAYVGAEVKVTVSNGVIESVELMRHKQQRGQAAEVLIGRVVEAQSLNLDTVSGATYSSKVILKAIENALTGAR